MINLVWILMSILIILLIAETVWRMIEKYKSKKALERARKELNESLDELLKNIEEREKAKQEEEVEEL